MDKNRLDLGDLDPIFKVTQGLKMLENGLSAPCVRKGWDMVKNLFKFRDPVPFFKVYKVLEC